MRDFHDAVLERLDRAASALSTRCRNVRKGMPRRSPVRHRAFRVAFLRRRPRGVRTIARGDFLQIGVFPRVSR